MREQEEGNVEHNPGKPYTGWDFIKSDPQIGELYSLFVASLSRNPDGLKGALSTPVNNTLAELRAPYIKNRR